MFFMYFVLLTASAKIDDAPHASFESAWAPYHFAMNLHSKSEMRRRRLSAVAHWPPSGAGLACSDLAVGVVRMSGTFSALALWLQSGAGLARSDLAVGVAHASGAFSAVAPWL